jgi:hypothetical protein
MRAPRLLCLLLSALMCSAGCQCARAPEVALAPADAGVNASLAQLTQLKGQVWLERQAVRQPAQPMPLVFQDAVETAEEAAATVLFADGRQVDVGPRSRFELSSDTGGLLLQVARGTVLWRMQGSGARGEQTAQPLRIRTSQGTALLGPGAGEVSLGADGTNLQVEVRVGTIQFVSATDGKTTEASAGQRLTVTAGRVQLLERTPNVLVLEPVRVTVRVAGGATEIRKQGAAGWRRVGNRSEEVESGDALRTRSGRSVLTLADSSASMDLEAGGELTFVRGGHSEEADEAEVDLHRGALALRLAPQRTSRIKLSGLTLVTRTGGHFALRRTRTGYQVDAQSGDATLEHAGHLGEVRAGESALLEREKTPRVSVMEKAALSLAPRMGQQVFHPRLAQAALTWEGEEQDYEVEVASDAAFTQRLFAGTVHRPWVNVALPSRGTLHWRVRTPGGKSDAARGSATFAPEPRLRELARAQKEVPEEAPRTTIFFQDKRPSVTFVFRPHAEAARYRLSVYRAGELDRPLLERTVSGVRAPLEEGVLQEGAFLWSVTPLSAQGVALRGGRMSQLDIVYDNSVPNLVITAPKNGEPSRGRPVRTAGVAPRGSRLFINEQAVALDDGYRFSTSVRPIGQPVLLIFRIQRPGTPDTLTVRTLR